MPSTAFERDAIVGLLYELSAQIGADIELLSHPEDDPSGPLTVDALARINNELWAIDHMRLAYEPTVVPRPGTTRKRRFVARSRGWPPPRGAA